MKGASFPINTQMMLIEFGFPEGTTLMHVEPDLAHGVLILYVNHSDLPDVTEDGGWTAISPMFHQVDGHQKLVDWGIPHAGE